MVGWHHQFNGHELGQTSGDDEGQGSLPCCSPWGCRVECDLATEQKQTYKLLHRKGNHKKETKRQPREWEKIFANDGTDETDYITQQHN